MERHKSATTQLQAILCRGGSHLGRMGRFPFRVSFAYANRAGHALEPGAMLKVCKPEDEGCVPTYPVACSMTSVGDPAQKPEMPRLSTQKRRPGAQRTAVLIQAVG